MNKGITVECQCCGVKQDVTEMAAEDIFGFSMQQVRKILRDYREQVPHAESVSRQLTAAADTRAVMLGLLNSVATADSHDQSIALTNIRRFLMNMPEAK